MDENEGLAPVAIRGHLLQDVGSAADAGQVGAVLTTQHGHRLAADHLGAREVQRHLWEVVGGGGGGVAGGGGTKRQFQNKLR